MASAELSRRVEKIVAYSMLTTTMNIYIHELDDGLGGADNLDGLWGHRGATKTRRQPQTGRTRNSRIPVWKRQPQTAAKRWTSYESAALTAELPAPRRILEPVPGLLAAGPAAHLQPDCNRTRPVLPAFMTHTPRRPRHCQAHTDQSR